MCRFVMNFLKISLGLTSAMMLGLALPAQAAASGAIRPEALLLAQSAEAQKAKPEAESTRTQEAEQQKHMEMEKSRETQIQMEHQAPKTRALDQPPAAAGSKKIGGQIIRDKKSPDGE